MRRPYYPTAAAIPSIAQVFHAHGKIEAVKYVRETFGLSLMESKEFVEKNVDGASPWTSRLPVRGTDRDVRAPQFAVPPHETSEPESGSWQPSRFLAIQTLFWWVLAAVAFGGAYWNWSTQENFIERAETVTAEVVSMHSSQGRGLCPVFAYRFGGENRQWNSPISVNPPLYAVGDTVDVFVDPESPGSVLVNDITHRWFLIAVAICFGTAFSFAGGVCRFMSSRF
ncbi:DUF3592 domain-containing protein [Aporhodopirellula aestuarii]|uniref:DUF3592 domain-containing protein n=1 Tax=Aporhodopirellula aestuarii TaxID=2950107 RepID=A0ABT0U456_9BACT|nr:DUF3592 domain-containing protein [Aporhodopirellula aestuarii]MCM2371699.1 DUF3592 domain-containing protein [Aporhodopirellula aestuarii]